MSKEKLLPIKMEYKSKVKATITQIKITNQNICMEWSENNYWLNEKKMLIRMKIIRKIKIRKQPSHSRIKSQNQSTWNG